MLKCRLSVYFVCIDSIHISVFLHTFMVGASNLHFTAVSFCWWPLSLLAKMTHQTIKICRIVGQQRRSKYCCVPTDYDIKMKGIASEWCIEYTYIKTKFSGHTNANRSFASLDCWFCKSIDDWNQVSLAKIHKSIVMIDSWLWIMMECSYVLLIVIWLVVWNMNFIFPNSWDDDPIWLSYSSGGLKPPTSYYAHKTCKLHDMTHV